MTKEEYLRLVAGHGKGGSKYHNVKTGANDSRKEHRRAGELQMMQRAGLISDLQEQVWVEIIPAQYIDGKCVEKSLRWKADFVYTDNQTGKKVYEDVKGYRTQDYINKRKMLLFLHGIRIKET